LDFWINWKRKGDGVNMNLQPYQQASDEIQRQSSIPGKALRSVGTAASVLAGGGGLLSRILPFLNQHIPEELIRKGLNKINPAIGNFVSSALNSGHNIDEVKDFITEKLNPQEEKQEEEEGNNYLPVPLEFNSFSEFEKYYPNVSKIIRKQARNYTVKELVDNIKKTPELSQEVQKGEKDTGKDLLDYMRELFGETSSQNNSAKTQPNAQDQLTPFRKFEASYPHIAQAIGKQSGKYSLKQIIDNIKNTPELSREVQQLEKDTGKDLYDYLTELFGGTSSQKNPQQAQLNPQDQLQAEPQSQQSQPQQSQPQQGLDPQLLNLMNQIKGNIQNLQRPK